MAKAITKPHFRGPPKLIEGLVPQSTLPEGPQKARLQASLPTVLKLKLPTIAEGKEWPARVVTSHRGNLEAPARVRFRLPDSTPPGTYEAELMWGEEQVSAQIEVEHYPDLLCVPSSYRFTLSAGQPLATTAFEMGLVNRGNCEWKLRKVHAFGLFQVGGVENAFAAIYRQPELRGNERIDAFGDELSKRHAFVRVQLERATTLAVGASTRIKGTLTWPEKMLVGCRYRGTWPLANLRISIRVDFADHGSREPSSHDEPTEII